MGESSAAIEQRMSALLLQSEQEGLLDAQFLQLLQLQDESNPDFVAEVVMLYFEDSNAKLEQMGGMLQANPPDFNEIDQMVHQFKGSSASLGAKAIAQLCVTFRDCCQLKDLPGCGNTLSHMHQAYSLLKSRLELFLQMENQVKQLKAAGQ